MENQKRQKIMVTIETGEQKEAEILSVVEMDGKEYVIYIMKNDKGLYDIMANYLVKDERGYDTFVTIDDIIDKIKITKYIESVFGDGRDFFGEEKREENSTSDSGNSELEKLAKEIFSSLLYRKLLYYLNHTDEIGISKEGFYSIEIKDIPEVINKWIDHLFVLSCVSMLEEEFPQYMGVYRHFMDIQKEGDRCGSVTMYLSNDFVGSKEKESGDSGEVAGKAPAKAEEQDTVPARIKEADPVERKMESIANAIRMQILKKPLPEMRNYFDEWNRKSGELRRIYEEEKKKGVEEITFLAACKELDDSKIAKEFKKKYTELYDYYEKVYMPKGSVVQFGKVDGYLWEWIVLDCMDSKRLLISKYVIFKGVYGGCTWEDCRLRKGLNSREFLKEHFDSRESDVLYTTCLVEPKHTNGGVTATRYVPGYETHDILFLLSQSECGKYFPTEKDLICYYVNNRWQAANWWLRSNTYDLEGIVSITGLGKVWGDPDYALKPSQSCGVRPAMQLDLTSWIS